MTSTSTTSADTYIDAPAAAAMLGVHIDTIRGLIHRGDLPALRVGRHFRIRVADIDALRVKPGE